MTFGNQTYVQAEGASGHGGFMAFDGITIAALVKELNTKLVDSYISRIVQPEKDELLITTRAGRTITAFILAPAPPFLLYI